MVVWPQNTHAYFHHTSLALHPRIVIIIHQLHSHLVLFVVVVDLNIIYCGLLFFFLLPFVITAKS